MYLSIHRGGSIVKYALEYLAPLGRLPVGAFRDDGRVAEAHAVQDVQETHDVQAPQFGAQLCVPIAGRLAGELPDHVGARLAALGRPQVPGRPLAEPGEAQLRRNAPTAC